jgi:predicted TIM-barrel fold metal-dependent hydrolase
MVDRPRHRPNYEYTAEQHLATLDRHGIQFGVITAASLFGTYNDYTIAAAKANKRLRATVIVDPSIDPYTMQHMKDDGVIGIRLVWIALETPPAIDCHEYRLLLRRVRDLDWHVHLHVGAGRLPGILPHIEASGAKVVIDHFGNPDPVLGVNCPTFQAVLRSIDSGRTWVKFSGAYRVRRERAKEYARELLKVAGPDRLVWGSDAPFAGFESSENYQRTLDDFFEWVPSPEDRRKIISVTPLKLFFGIGC